MWVMISLGAERETNSTHRVRFDDFGAGRVAPNWERRGGRTDALAELGTGTKGTHMVAHGRTWMNTDELDECGLIRMVGGRRSAYLLGPENPGRCY